MLDAAVEFEEAHEMPISVDERLVSSMDTMIRSYDLRHESHPGEFRGGMDQLVVDLVGFTTTGKDITPGLRSVLHETGRKVGKDGLKQLLQYFKHTGDMWSAIIDAASKISEIGETEATVNEKSHLASHQQRLAQSLFHIGKGDPNSPEFLAMRVAMTCIKSMRDSSDSNLVRVASWTMDGAIAQANLMRLMDDSGYFIMCPDPEDKVDMEKTDLKGIDFVAISPEGEMFFVDAKSRMKLSSPVVVRRNTQDKNVIDYVNQQVKLAAAADGGPHPNINARMKSSHPPTAVKIELPGRPNFVDVGKISAPYESTFRLSVINQLGGMNRGQYEAVA